MKANLVDWALCLNFWPKLDYIGLNWPELDRSQDMSYSRKG